MATVLNINGSVVGRTGAHLILNALTLSLEDPDRLSFTELRLPAGTGSWSQGDPIVAVVDGVTRFRGMVASAQPSAIGSGCINVSYTALGLRFLANLIFFTAPDLTGSQAWNMPRTDLAWGASSIGKSVGEILEEVLDAHQAKLTAIGMATPAYDPAETAALTVVPRDAVVFSGRLLDNCADLISTWMPKFTCYPDASDGLIHFRNTLTLPQITLTLDSDPVSLESISKSHAECFTRVVCRGGPDVRAAYLSLSENTLAAGWTAPEQAAWTIADYWNPKGSSSAGNITAMSSTTLTVTSDDTAEAWATTTHWADVGGVVWAYDPAATGITFSEHREITANTVKAAGAGGTLTVDFAWNNSGYTRYQIRGNFADQALVWRKLVIVPVDGGGHNWVADHLVRTMPHSFPWSPSDKQETQVTSPTAVVCWSASGSPPYNEWPWPFEIVLPSGTDPGYIVFDEPIVKAYSTRTALEAGGGAVLPPGDIKVLVPYSVGALSVTMPPDVSGVAQYEGTAHVVDGIDRTLYREYPDWLDGRDAAKMSELAREVLDSVKDTVFEGSATYEGKLTSVLTMGKALNIARAGGTTGWEALKAIVTEVSLEYQDNASIWITRVRFSTRRKPFCGDRLYAPVAWGSAAQLNHSATILYGMGPSPYEMAQLGQMSRVNLGADPMSAGVDPTRGLADPLGAPGVQLPEDQDTGGYEPEGPGRRPGRRPAAARQRAGMAATFAEGLEMFDAGLFDTPDVDERRERAAARGSLREARYAPGADAPEVGSIGEELAQELITPEMRRRARARGDVD